MPFSFSRRKLIYALVLVHVVAVIGMSFAFQGWKSRFLTFDLLPHIQSGAIRPIAVTTLRRTAALPDVPTIAESGFPGFDATTWHALVAPAGTPKDVIAALHRALTATVNDPAVRKALTDLGVDVVGGTPDELRAYIKAEIPKWAAVVKASGAKLD